MSVKKGRDLWAHLNTQFLIILNSKFGCRFLDVFTRG